jgi:asparagine synthase (glutamine-hydrolysing)
MIGVFGSLPRDRRPSALAPVRPCAERDSVWELGGGAVGANDLVPPAPPLVSADRRHHLWGVGEIFSGLLGVPLPATLQDPAVRRALLRALLHDGAAALAHVNGEFQVALWDEVEGTLLLAADRFGCVPIYWTLTPGRFVFGPTVDQLLPVPGVGTAPDEDAIREAVTFGGFRLADRTSVRGVRMLRGGRVLVLENGAVTERRYWKWPPPPEPTTRTLDLLVQEAYERWQGAIRRRLHGAARPGGTLSGGLDSRAIMAEARAQGATWRALTYGIPRCDDARLARRAAAAAGAEWRFAALYEGDWLARRTTYVAQTDGLVQLADLMHF